MGKKSQHQTPEALRAKYKALREAGLTSREATKYKFLSDEKVRAMCILSSRFKEQLKEVHARGWDFDHEND